MLETGSSIDYKKAELYEQLLNSIEQQFATEAEANKFTGYQDNPVGFGQEVLGETYTDEVKALMESVRDNVITLAKSPNAVGKTHGAARVAVWWYKAFLGSQVYTAAAPPEANLKKLLWGEIGSITEKHPEIFEGDVITNLHIQRSAQSFITGVTIPTSGTAEQREAKFSGKHAPHLLFILDEGDAVPDEVYRGIESCMSGGHARLLVIFNPRAEIGEAYRMERDGRANVVELSAFNHPNVVTGIDKIPGAVTRETTVRRINEWCRPLMDGERKDGDCFKLPDFLVAEIAKSQSGQEYPPLSAGFYKIMDPAFSYMVLGQYPPQGTDQLIARQWISLARARWDKYVQEHGEVPPPIKAVAGEDVAEMGGDQNSLCFRYGDYVERLQTWQGMDVLQSADYVAMQCQTRKIHYVSVCAIGVGAGVAPQLNRNKVPGVPCKVSEKRTDSL
jgi:hypothetical protein